MPRIQNGSRQEHDAYGQAATRNLSQHVHISLQAVLATHAHCYGHAYRFNAGLIHSSAHHTFDGRSLFPSWLG